jgi:hypothetical protein
MMTLALMLRSSRPITTNQPPSLNGRKVPTCLTPPAPPFPR